MRLPWVLAIANSGRTIRRNPPKPVRPGIRPMATKAKSRPKKIAYEPVLKLPPLRYEDFVALRDNISVNGVLVPILVDSDGPRRKIIDGNYRKQIAEELNYDCPEIVHPNLDDDEKRLLARALNLARRHLSQEQKRELIADQLEEHRKGRIDGLPNNRRPPRHSRCRSRRTAINWTN